MLKIQHLSDDAVKLRFIPFALRDNAKKWLYSLVTNSITTWKEFIAVFLKKYFPMHKTTKIRGEINQCRQKSGAVLEIFGKIQGLVVSVPSPCYREMAPLPNYL